MAGDDVNDDGSLAEDMMNVEALLGHNVVQMVKDNLILDLLRTYSSDRDRVQKVVSEIQRTYLKDDLALYMDEDDDVLLALDSPYLSSSRTLDARNGSIPSSSLIVTTTSSGGASSSNNGGSGDPGTIKKEVVLQPAKLNLSAAVRSNCHVKDASTGNLPSVSLNEPLTGSFANHRKADHENYDDSSWTSTSDDSSRASPLSTNSSEDSEPVVLSIREEDRKRKKICGYKSPGKKTRVEIVDLVHSSPKSSLNYEDYLGILEAMFPDADPIFLMQKFQHIENEQELNVVAATLLESNNYPRIGVGAVHVGGERQSTMNINNSSVIIKPSAFEVPRTDEPQPGTSSNVHISNKNTVFNEPAESNPDLTLDDILSAIGATEAINSLSQQGGTAPEMPNATGAVKNPCTSVIDKFADASQQMASTPSQVNIEKPLSISSSGIPKEETIDSVPPHPAQTVPVPKTLQPSLKDVPTSSSISHKTCELPPTSETLPFPSSHVENTTLPPFSTVQNNGVVRSVDEPGPSHEKQEPWVDKYSILLSLFPESDPTYLKNKAKLLHDKDIDFNLFVETTLENLYNPPRVIDERGDVQEIPLNPFKPVSVDQGSRIANVPLSSDANRSEHRNANISVPKAANVPQTNSANTKGPANVDVPRTSSASVPRLASTSTSIPRPSAANAPATSSANVPRPSAFNAPAPSSANVPRSSAFNTPTPSSVNVPRPSASNAPATSSANVPRPSAFNAPAPSSANVPRPSASNAPATSSANVPRSSAFNAPTPSSANVPRPRASNAPATSSANVPRPSASNAAPSSVNVQQPNATSIPRPSANNAPAPSNANVPPRIQHPGPSSVSVERPSAANAPNAPPPSSVKVQRPSAASVPGPSSAPVPGPSGLSVAGPSGLNVPGPSGLNNDHSSVSPWSDKHSFLLSILPDADPTFLEEKAKTLYDKDEDLKTFVSNALENKDYPTLKDYQRQQEIIALQNKYLNDFNIENFLDIVPEPFKYFSQTSRKPSPDSRERGLLYLKRKYRVIRSNDINAVYKKHQYNLTNTCHELNHFKGVPLKSRRPDFVIADKLADSNLSLQYLQEVAFIENEQKIRKYLEDKESEEERALKEARDKGELLECNCCFDDEVLARNIVTCPEGHIFCKSCVRKGAETKIGEGETKISCLTDCQAEFTLQSLQGVLKPTVFSKLAQRKQVEEIKAAGIEDLVQCPFCDFCNIPGTGDKIFRCLNPDCMKDSCLKCKEESHIPLRCDEVEKASEVKMRTYIEDKMTEALVRTCWKCQRKFVKIDGCNKMTCQCGALMCYICRQPVKDYSHFNGQGGDDFHKCPLFSDNNSLHVDAVEKVAAEAKAELAQKHPGVALKHDPTAVPIPREAGGRRPGQPNPLPLGGWPAPYRFYDLHDANRRPPPFIPPPMLHNAPPMVARPLVDRPPVAPPAAPVRDNPYANAGAANERYDVNYPRAAAYGYPYHPPPPPPQALPPAPRHDPIPPIQVPPVLPHRHARNQEQLRRYRRDAIRRMAEGLHRLTADLRRREQLDAIRNQGQPLRRPDAGLAYQAEMARPAYPAVPPPVDVAAAPNEIYAQNMLYNRHPYHPNPN